MNHIARPLAIAGALLAGPSFIFNVIAHGGTFPGPDEMDRADGAFSVMFIAGAALVVAALFLVKPSPLGRKGRYLLYVEAILVAMATYWAINATIDPELVDDPNVLVAICDGAWPLHQVFMLVIGIVAARAKLWPSPERYTLFGPVVGILVLGIGAATGIDYLAAAGIGSGWVITAIGILRVTGQPGRVETLLQGPSPEPA